MVLPEEGTVFWHRLVAVVAVGAAQQPMEEMP